MDDDDQMRIEARVSREFDAAQAEADARYRAQLAACDLETLIDE